MVMHANKKVEKGNKKEHSSDESEDSSESETSGTESSSNESDTSGSESSTSSDSVDGKTTKQKQAAKQAEENKGKKRNLGRNNKGKAANANNANKKPKKRRRKPRPLTICLTNCRYEIVRNAAKRYSLMEVGEDESWNIYWTDFSVSFERAMDMRRYQLVNHFPGMNEICRKDLLSRNLNRMKRLFQNDYDIFPKTWSLPADLGDLQQYAHTRKNKTYICKPEMGCQGRGIFLIRNIKDLNPFGKIICQLYVSRPFLIDNFKFDLRIYVLMTTCDPLRIYVYNEGLARFATAKYKPPTNSNTENSYMHLTNYAVNKYSRDFVVDDEGGSKRKLTAVYRWLQQRSYDTEELIASIDDVIIKTIISAHPILKHNYRTCFPHHDLCSACFEILGFDILLDHKLKPYVLEVNHSPSFHTDARLDRDIKEGLLNDTFAMLNMKQLDRYKVESDDRRRVQDRLMQKHAERKERKEPELIDGLSPADHQFQWELDHCGGYRLVYPSPHSEKYDKFFEQNLSSLYHETASSQARASCTRNQMEEYNKMKQQEERKRLALGQAAERPKDKVRPESPADPDKPKLKKKMSKMVLKKPKDIGGFVPGPIIADEELDRMKSLMQRGMLIRSLGIELQVFKLLCQIGNLKPEEEKIFRRMHGFTSSLTKPKDGLGRRDRMELMEQMQKGEPLTAAQGTEVSNRTETTSRGDFSYPGVSSTTLDSSQSFRQTCNSPKLAANAINADPISIKNPYSVPYNSPAQFGVYQTRPKSSLSPQSGYLPVQNISNFMDKVNTSVMNVSDDDQPIITANTPGFYQPVTERRFLPNKHAGHILNEGMSPMHPGNNSPLYPPKVSVGQSRLSSFANDTQTFVNIQNLQRTLNNLRHPPRTAVVSNAGNMIGTLISDSASNSGRVMWPPPPLAQPNAQYPNDPTKLRAPVLATKSFRPQGGEMQADNWTSSYANKAPTSVANGNPFIRRPKPSVNRDDNEPVKCTQMFLNNNTIPSHSSGSGKTETRQGVTNLNFLRGVGNVALLRVGRLNVRSGTVKQPPPAALLPLPVSKINQPSNSLSCKGVPIGQDGSAFN